MADYFLLFSESFELKSEQEAEWIVNFLEHPPKHMFDEPDVEDAEANDQPLTDLISFEWSIEGAPGYSSLWIKSDEFGNPYQVGVMLQALLREFRPEEHMHLEYAEICSKPRAGAFGGGAVFVTSEKIELMSTSSWVCQKLDELEAGEKKS